MPSAQGQPIFTAEEARRFAALVAGLDTGNACEAEAAGKFRAARRMVTTKGLRLVDALELPEIRRALDDQMRPIRAAGTDGAALAAAKAEAEELRGRLATVVPKLREVTEALIREKELTARLRAQPQPPQPNSKQSVSARPASGVNRPILGAPSFGFEIAAAIAAAVMMILAMFR